MALVEHRKLRVRCHSVSSGKVQWRELVSAGLSWGGQRWQVRTWRGLRGEWRAFVMDRMSAADWPGEPAGDLPEDTAWTMFEIVKLRLNLELSAKPREGQCMDYGRAKVWN